MSFMKLAQRAFSLIELLVVVAIIGILAAVSIPAYQRYTITSRLAAARTIVEELTRRSIEFSATHGRYGNAYDLGLTPTNTYSGFFYATDSLVSTMMGPYFLSSASGGGLSVLDWGAFAGGTPCGQEGAVYAVFDAQKLGFSTSVATNNNGHALGDGMTGGVILSCGYWHYNKVIYKACWYSYGTAAVSGADNILPGWFNWNKTTAWDKSGSAGNPLYNTYGAKTCM